MFKSSWEWLLLILGFFYWATVGLLITFLGITLSFLLSRQNALKSGRFLLSKAFKFFISFLRITGLLILDDSELKNNLNKIHKNISNLRSNNFSNITQGN